MITAKLVGVSTAIQRLESMPRRVREELAKEVKEQTVALLGRAKEKVSGEVLKNRTGTLRRKLNMAMDVAGDRVIGTVGIKLKYAAVHEFGFDGVVQVKAHDRRLNIRKELVEMKDGSKRRIKTWDGVAHVTEHKRHMRMPERSYLRTALDERRDAIEAGIAAAVKRGTSK